MFEAKLGRAADDIRLPDYEGTVFEGPPDDFVVSFRRDGTPASKFGDLVWDFTAYHPEQRTFCLHFAYWGEAPALPAQVALSREVRRVIFSLIWHRPGAPLALRTLVNYLIVLNGVARHAEQLGMRLGELLSDSTALPRYAVKNCSGWMCETMGSLLGVLARLDSGAVGFMVVPSKTINMLKAHSKNYRAGVRQHAPIPTRIYSALISSLQLELSSWRVVSKDALELATACGIDPFLGRSYEQQRDSIAKKLKVQFAEFSARPVFDEICGPSVANYLLTAEKDQNVKSLSFVISEMQLVCKLIIQAFTGMRDDEASSLPYDCLEATVANGKTHYVVKGRTTKFNHGLPKSTQWVTNQDGRQAIEAAQDIAIAIFKVYGHSAESIQGRSSKYPLFPSPGYLNLASQPKTPVDDHFVPSILIFAQGSVLPARLFSVIEDVDIKELEQIDPHRAWRSETDFQPGRRWCFKTHQLRRSLALYAQRSGLVSLPSLRRQLQHLTEEMARYYAKGSTFAKDFIGEDKDHFGLEWQATQPESAALGYILNVLMSDDVLMGGHGNWVQHRLKGAEGAVLPDRAVTMQRFSRGEMAYRETLLGGCTAIEECDQVALNWLSVDCLRDGCKNMVCNLNKLKRVVAAQERLVAGIDPSSVEYRTESADLEVLRSAMSKVKLVPEGETQ